MENNKYELQINPGQVYEVNQTQYRILHVQHSIAFACEMNTSKLNFHCFPIREIVDSLYNGQASLVNLPPQKIFDASQFSPAQKESYEKKLRLVQAIKDAYGPSYIKLKDRACKSALNQCIEESGLSRKTVLATIRRFLQSGEDITAIFDRRLAPSVEGSRIYHRKPGSPSPFGILADDTVKARFDEALNYFKVNRLATIRDAYHYMLQKHFSSWEDTEAGGKKLTLFPATQRPTERQFRYFVQNNMSTEELDIKKTSAREVKNNKRLLLGNNLSGVQGPGDLFEMDQVETDVSLVSRLDPQQAIGRPIVHIMVDVYSRLIVAFSVSLSNNSLEGMTNCFLSLLDDKVELCNKFDLVVHPNEWPSCILPNRIRCDYGSEYRSKSAEQLFASLGITRELVPPAMGSMKGQVEQTFRQMHRSFAPQLSEKGFIEKRHDSKHHKKATLNIDDFMVLLVQFIVSHNKQYMKEYPLTPEMMCEKISPTPIEIWLFGCKHFGQPKVIQNKDQFRFNLMKPVQASISRHGLKYNGLYYINMNDSHLLAKAYNAGNTQDKMDARIDPRNIGSLYYIDHNKNLAVADLNQDKNVIDFRGYSLSEYTLLRKEKTTLDKMGALRETERKTELFAQQESVVHKASRGRTSPNKTTDMRMARRMEKLDVGQDFSIKNRPDSVAGNSASPLQTDNGSLVEENHSPGSYSLSEAQIQAFMLDINPYFD